MFDIFTRYPILLWPVGPALLIWAVLSFRRINIGHQNWPRTTAVITCKEMEKHHARLYGVMYQPSIAIRYTVQGREYTATFHWDDDIHYEKAKETIATYRDQGVIGIQYAPFNPAVVRIRPGKLNNEAFMKYLVWGGVGVALSILTSLAAIGNLL